MRVIIERFMFIKNLHQAIAKEELFLYDIVVLKGDGTCQLATWNDSMKNNYYQVLEATPKGSVVSLAGNDTVFMIQE